jgi:Coenzyme PQQ synthesis protein D (PqqD)
MPDPQDFPKASKDVLVQKTVERVVLLDSRRGEYFSLDEVGARIWQLCDGNHSRADIVRDLCEEYDVEPEVLRSDLDGLLTKLAKARLISFR